VYEGVHHPTDVIGGAVLGVVALFVAGVSTGLIVPPRRASATHPSAYSDGMGVTSS
jgi:membrane-associated phospholipid phosphatase